MLKQKQTATRDTQQYLCKLGVAIVREAATYFIEFTIITVSETDSLTLDTCICVITVTEISNAMLHSPS
jgi:hypothetical protein